MGTRPGTEDFENEAGAIDDFAFPRALEIALLHRGDRRIDDGNPNALRLDGFTQLCDNTAAQQCRGPQLAQRQDFRARDIEIDRPRQSHRFLETWLRRAAAIAPLPRHLERWVNDQGASNRRALGGSCRSRQTSPSSFRGSNS